MTEVGELVSVSLPALAMAMKAGQAAAAREYSATSKEQKKKEQEKGKKDPAKEWSPSTRESSPAKTVVVRGALRPAVGAGAARAAKAALSQADRKHELNEQPGSGAGGGGTHTTGAVKKNLRQFLKERRGGNA